MAKESYGEITRAGAGWMTAGIASILLYAYKPGSPSLLIVGMLALLTGLWIIIARKQIAALRKRILASRGYKSK